MKLKLLAVLFACFNPTALWAAQQSNADISDPQELVDIVNSRLDSMRADHSPVVTKLPELDRQKLQEVINQNQDIAKSEALLKGQALMNTGSRVFTDLKNNEDMNSLVKEGQALEEKYGDPQRSNSMLNHYDILIFISFSLDEQTLKQLLTTNAGNPRVALVIRGLLKGTSNINQTILKIQQLAASLKLDEPPTVLINPVWFQQYGITEVPTVVALTNPAPEQSGDINTNKTVDATPEYARVRGLIDPHWLTAQVTQGKRGDLGTQGPTAEIEERDLIEEMQERADRIDWQQKKLEAYKRVWKNIAIEPLEPAEKYRKRLLDPTFTVTEDITAEDPRHEGQSVTIATKGQKINPLDVKNFTQMMVIFDPTTPGEKEYIMKNLDSWLNQRHMQRFQANLMMTDFDREGGWKAYSELSDFFDKHIFALQPEIKTRFALEKHPCIVYQEGNLFAVEEFDIHAEPKD